MQPDGNRLKHFCVGFRRFAVPVLITQFVLIKANAKAKANADAHSDLPRIPLTSSTAHPLHIALGKTVKLHAHIYLGNDILLIRRVPNRSVDFMTIT